ncbi:hypothetical protein N431DRAFT_561781 [Stipitochalara longipes BDJ]|nr:hypothetical protein N431DRAFT_561781 [Stipitochalara longipes BDJ]
MAISSISLSLSLSLLFIFRFLLTKTLKLMDRAISKAQLENPRILVICLQSWPTPPIIDRRRSRNDTKIDEVTLAHYSLNGPIIIGSQYLGPAIALPAIFQQLDNQARKYGVMPYIPEINDRVLRRQHSVSLAYHPASPNLENTSQNSQDRAAAEPLSRIKAKIKAFHLSRQGAPAAQPQGSTGSTPHSPDLKGRKTQGLPPGSVNPGGPMIRVPSSLVGSQDEQTRIGNESGDTQDVRSQSGSLSEYQTGTKKDEDKKGEGVSRVMENDNAEVAE